MVSASKLCESIIESFRAVKLEPLFGFGLNLGMTFTFGRDRERFTVCSNVRHVLNALIGFHLKRSQGNYYCRLLLRFVVFIFSFDDGNDEEEKKKV